MVSRFTRKDEHCIFITRRDYIRPTVFRQPCSSVSYMLPWQPFQYLQSYTTTFCHFSTNKLTTMMTMSFLVAASVLWNSLPRDIPSSPSSPVFRQRLKTFLFRKSFPGILLWPPHGIGQAIIFSCCGFFTVALCSRADHYIFAL